MRFVLLACFALCGCETTSPAPAIPPVADQQRLAEEGLEKIRQNPLTKEQRCEFIGIVLASNDVSDFTKLQLFEIGKNIGCYGQPQRQTIIIRRE